jgi:hypothetical protein
MSTWVFFAALLATPHVTESRPRPTQAALRRAFENNRSSIVEVIGPKRSGIGVIVGAAGQVLTSVEYVGRYQAKVKVGGQELAARVVMADARLKVALLEMAVPGSFRSVAVKLQESLPAGSWLLALVRPNGRKPSVLVGKVRQSNLDRPPFAELDLALSAGHPLFDERGRLVALVVQRNGRRGSSIVPVSALNSQVATSESD